MYPWNRRNLYYRWSRPRPRGSTRAPLLQIRTGQSDTLVIRFLNMTVAHGLVFDKESRMSGAEGENGNNHEPVSILELALFAGQSCLTPKTYTPSKPINRAWFLTALPLYPSCNSSARKMHLVRIVTIANVRKPKNNFCRAPIISALAERRYRIM